MDEEHAPQVGAPQAVLPPQERRNQAMDATPEQPDSTYLSPSDETSPIAASSSTALSEAASDIADLSMLTAIADTPDMPQLDMYDAGQDDADAAPAKALGLSIPPSVFLRADRVIV